MSRANTWHVSNEVGEEFAAGDGLQESSQHGIGDADEIQIGGDDEITVNDAGAEFGQAFALLEHDLHPMAYGAVFFLPHEWTQMKDHE